MISINYRYKIKNRYISIDLYYFYSEVRKNMMCNGCGKSINTGSDMDKDIIYLEDFVKIRKEWGYFSKKDGETHELILCEECYDRLCKNLTIPVNVKETAELLGN